MTPEYLWLDLETTGLDAEKCQILEIATTLDGCADVECLVRPSVPMELVHWEPFALEMHKKSGLYQDWLVLVETGRLSSVHAIEDILLAQLSHFPPRSVMLAGSSIHFDRGFLSKHMPRLDSALHYRHMDVSCLRTFFVRECGPQFEFPAREKPHRAKADLENSRALYLKYAEALWQSGGR